MIVMTHRVNSSINRCLFFYPERATFETHDRLCNRRDTLQLAREIRSLDASSVTRSN